MNLKIYRERRTMFHLITAVIAASWPLLLDSSVYILFGILISGLLKMVLNPATSGKTPGFRAIQLGSCSDGFMEDFPPC